MIAPVLLVALMAGESHLLLVMPMEAEGDTWTVAQAATARVATALGSIPDTRVLSPEQVSRQLGIDVALEANACKKEMLCLVQIGEAVGADRLLTGALARNGDAYDLRLSLVDVARAQMIDTLRWQFPVDSLEDAVGAGARKLAKPPDARVIFALEPPDAKIEIYGELHKGPSGRAVPFWSGRYRATVTAPGFERQEVTFRVPRGGPTTVNIALESDPLSLDARMPRRSGAGTERGAGVAVLSPVSSISDALLNPFAWGMIGLGGAAGLVGGLVMSSAQSSYNGFSAEARYGVATRSAVEAIEARDSAQAQFTAGQAALIAGVVVAAGGIVWMVIDMATPDASPPRGVPVVDGTGGRGCVWSF